MLEWPYDQKPLQRLIFTSAVLLWLETISGCMMKDWFLWLLCSWDWRLWPRKAPRRLQLQVPVLPKALREAGKKNCWHSQDWVNVCGPPFLYVCLVNDGCSVKIPFPLSFLFIFYFVNSPYTFLWLTGEMWCVGSNFVLNLFLSNYSFLYFQNCLLLFVTFFYLHKTDTLFTFTHSCSLCH